MVKLKGFNPTNLEDAYSMAIAAIKEQMSKITLCDRCGNPVPQYDVRALDHISLDYPGRDIYLDCFLLLELGATLTKRDIEKGQKAGTTLRKLAKLYQII